MAGATPPLDVPRVTARVWRNLSARWQVAPGRVAQCARYGDQNKAAHLPGAVAVCRLSGPAWLHTRGQRTFGMRLRIGPTAVGRDRLIWSNGPRTTRPPRFMPCVQIIVVESEQLLPRADVVARQQGRAAARKRRDCRGSPPTTTWPLRTTIRQLQGEVSWLPTSSSTLRSET